ncbi:hypothetical protein ONS95_014965 [Cadophora gregata]|uniref:uncharacterized protein n=1 Tax=Cadophora gregata TaxID=51156 RepID=UPI0026DB6A74|nr:uncharacterized protein ONS95_014965 [Cadophora gregata]KAK0103167.1 hypothetical protein ONS96_005774 [Cadophora gregata f. sp. sojae]KAK0113270.1 hypothetical protein ONS95_014965 [Cadophora gregata]
MSSTTAFVGLGLRLRAVGRWPLDRLLVWGIKLLASLRTYFRPQIIYKPLGANELRVLAIYPPLTNRLDEPVHCSLHHVALEHTPEYKNWEKQSDPNLHLYKKTRAWVKYVEARKAEGDPYFKKNGAMRHNWGDYVTLSYSWGLGIQDHRVIIDGQFVAVTESLYLAMQTIRQGGLHVKSPTHPKFRLWVDAICIDQQNASEQGREVRRMKMIYGDSIGGFVHLGSASDDSDLAMNSINSIAQSLRTGYDCSKWLVDISSEAETSWATPSIKAIMKLLSRRYWSRMWIIQELAMGQDQMVLCGDSCSTLIDIRQILRLFVLNLEQVVAIIGYEDYIENTDSFQCALALLWWIGRVRELVTQSNDSGRVNYRDLRSPVLGLTQYASATDPRDKIYGMMGILPGALASKIDKKSMNYELSTREVFLGFSRAVIETTGDLDIIYTSHLQQATRSDMGLPSWATDWTLKNCRTASIDNSMEWYFGLEDGEDKLPAATTSMTGNVGQLSRADGGRIANITFSDDGELLYCEGFCIATIDGHASELVAAQSETPAMSASPDLVVQPTAQDICPYGGSSGIMEALVRTLLLDPIGVASSKCPIFQIPWGGAEADSDAETGECTFGDESIAYFANLRENGWNTTKFGGSFISFEFLRRRLGLFQIGGRVFKEYFPRTVSHAPPEDIDCTSIKDIVSNAICRRLITTKSGHVGMAPATVVPGDSVYILLGCAFPVILRPGKITGQYKVVGECYVDGFMKGEAIQGLDSGEFQLQQITLC